MIGRGGTRTFRSLLGAVVASALASIPIAAAAQSVASDYTNAVRVDNLGRQVGTIAADPDGTGPIKHAATRTTYNARQLPVLTETGELATWQSEDVAPADWGNNFLVHSSVETQYDINRRKIREIARGRYGGAYEVIGVTEYSYDNRGRLLCTAVRMNHAEFSQASYLDTPRDACTLTAPATGVPYDRITKTIYDAAGQVLQVRTAVGVTGLEKADVTYTYTLNGQIEEVIDANGNRAKLEYDGHDRQTSWMFPAKTGHDPSSFDDTTYASALTTAGSLSSDDRESYEYDANGNRTKLTKRDGTAIDYQYDGLNRLVRKTVDAAGTRTDLSPIYKYDVTYTYDLRGLPLQTRFVGGHNAIQNNFYDGFGRLIQTNDNATGPLHVLQHRYDANGNRTRITYPGLVSFELAYDGLNRATELYEGTTLRGRMTYNNRGLPSEMDWSLSASKDNTRTYGYDSAGRIDEIGFDLAGPNADVSWSFTRNPASQILSKAQTNELYRWDGSIDITRNYAVNGLNQYTDIGTIEPNNVTGASAFCYDKNGNLTADGAYVFLYDVENRLVEKRVQGAGNTDCANLLYTGALKAQLLYDPLGRLVQVVGESSGAQKFVYDGNALIAEYDGNDVLQRRYVHGSNVEADDPLIWYEGADLSVRRHLHADTRGSIVAVTNHQGALLHANTYDEYGIPDGDSLSDPTAAGILTRGRFRYTGQVWLPELEMYYYKARIYSPKLGRFLQTDPIGYEDQFNLYAYVGNDPINSVDPTGMEEENEIKIPALIGATTITYDDSGITIEFESPVYDAGISLRNNGVNVSANSDGNQVNVSANSSGAAASLGVLSVGNASAAIRNPVQPYESGPFSDLQRRSVKGDGLDNHHAPQKHVAAQNFGSYSSADGPAIALPQAEHRAIPNIRGDVTLNPRSMLAQAARDLRNFTNAPNKKIQDWLKGAKDYFGF